MWVINWLIEGVIFTIWWIIFLWSGIGTGFIFQKIGFSKYLYIPLGFLGSFAVWYLRFKVLKI